MKTPRRLVEDKEFIAELIAEDECAAPRPEALQGLLKVLDTTLVSNAPLQKSSSTWTWLLIGASVVFGVLAFRYSSLLARTERRSTTTSRIASMASASTGGEFSAPPKNTAVEAAHSVAVGDLPDSLSGAPPSRARRREREEPARDAPSASTFSPTTNPSLRREVELIIAARQALTRGDADRCLSSVALYEAEFPAGQFIVEGHMMRIEAMALTGDRKRAAALARELIKRVPGSPYEARIRSLLADWERQ